MEYSEKAKFAVNLIRPPLAVVFTGVIMIGTVALPGIEFSAVLLAIFYGFNLCFLAFSINDYFDREIDEELGRTGGTKGALVQEEWQIKTVRYGVGFSTVLLLATLPIVSTLSKVCLIVLIILAFAYSAPPFRLKSVPIIDSITNGVAAFFMFSLGVGLMGGTFQDIIPAAYWGSLMFMPIHAIVSCPDIEADRKQGVRTAGTLIGWKGSGLWLMIATASSMTLETWDLIPFLAHFVNLALGFTAFYFQSEEAMYKFIEYSFKLGTLPGIIWLMFEIGLLTL